MINTFRILFFFFNLKFLFVIDIIGKAKLSDFGISRRLKQSETTLRTSIAGTRCWKAKETINEKFNTGYKRSADIQVCFQY